jgi:hypothetical protein
MAGSLVDSVNTAIRCPHSTQLQPQRYSEDFRQVGLIGTLLSGAAQACFAPSIQTSSPVLHNFAAFFVEFEATFGDTD